MARSKAVTYASRLAEDEALPDFLTRLRKEGVEFWSPQWTEFSRLQRFANQQHWPDVRRSTSGDNSGSDSPATRAPRLVFDKISPIVQAASGREMMQRFERVYLPRHNSAARAAESLTEVDRALMQATNDEQVTSAAFKDGPVIQGVSCVRWEMDALNEVGGGIVKRHLPMWQVMVDPNAREINYTDRGHHRYGEWWPQQSVRERWPDKYDDISSSIGASTWAPDESNESSRIPWTGMGGNKPLEVYYAKARSLWIEYVEWREVAVHYEVGRPADDSMSYADAMRAARTEGAPDPMTVARFDTKAEVTAFKDEHLAVFGEEVPKQLIVPKREYAYRYAYQCGDTVLETGPIPTGYWTLQFMTGFRFPQPIKTLFKSLVSRLVDPQKWINVAVSAWVRAMQVSPKGLLFVEEGFFRTRDEAMSSWANPGGVIVLPRGRLSGGTPGYKWESGGNSPYQGMATELLSMFDNLLPQIAGFNPAALGQLGGDLRRISGEVVRSVQDAAMTANAEMFDSLRLHRREGGRIVLSFLRTFFTPIEEHLVRIVGEENAYETITQPVMEPVIDPATGQPQMGEDGQPAMKRASDPLTGEALVEPMMDPTTGEPARRLALTEEMLDESYWKDITVEDAVPSGDQKAAFWKAMETSIQILMQPQPDTGRPVFGSDDIIEMAPGVPSHIRERMLQRVKYYRTMAWRQQQQAPPPGGEGGPEAQAPPAPPTNGSGAQPAA